MSIITANASRSHIEHFFHLPREGKFSSLVRRGREEDCLPHKKIPPVLSRKIAEFCFLIYVCVLLVKQVQGGGGVMVVCHLATFLVEGGLRYS